MLRRATHTDIPALGELFLRLKRHSNYATIPHDAERARATLRRCISSPQGYAAVVEDGGRIVAALIGVIDTYWWGPRRYASDLCYASLRRGAAAELLTDFENWAYSKPGVIEVLIGQSSGIKVSGTERFFSGLGYTREGGIYRKSIYEAMKVAV